MTVTEVLQRPAQGKPQKSKFNQGDHYICGQQQIMMLPTVPNNTFMSCHCVAKLLDFRTRPAACSIIICGMPMMLPFCFSSDGYEPKLRKGRLLFHCFFCKLKPQQLRSKRRAQVRYFLSSALQQIDDRTITRSLQ